MTLPRCDTGGRSSRPPPGSSPTLSIVVPTYNRSVLLKRLLDSIVSDFAVWPWDLELVVIDNASTDDTARMLETFRSRRPETRVLRQPENIGMDGNLAACFDAATGDRLWQIGDDEVLFAGTAAWVLDFCRTHDFGLLHLAHVGDSGELAVVPAVGLQAAPPDAVSMSSAEMIRHANIFLTFISANVVDRRPLLADPAFDAGAERGSFLPQLAWIYGALRCGDRHFAVRRPMFAARTDNTGGYQLVQVFGTNLEAITARRLGPHGRAARRIMANAALLRLFPAQLLTAPTAAGRSFVAEDVVGKLDALYVGRPYHRWLLRPTLLGTGATRRLGQLAIRVLNRIDRAIGHRLL